MNQWTNYFKQFRYVTQHKNYSIYKERIRATDKQVYCKVNSPDVFYIINQKEKKLL